MNRNGFSLLEFMIYLMASVTLCMILCSWVVRALHANSQISQKNSAQIMALSALDCCARDIMAAPSGSSAWLKTAPTYILWHQLDHVVGYQFDKKQILRVSGRYNTATQSIYKKTRSRIASQVTDCQFLLKKERSVIKGINIQFVIQKGDVQNECKQYIALRNH